MEKVSLFNTIFIITVFKMILQSDTEWATDNITNGALILLQQRYGVPGLQNVALAIHFHLIQLEQLSLFKS